MVLFFFLSLLFIRFHARATGKENSSKLVVDFVLFFVVVVVVFVVVERKRMAPTQLDAGDPIAEASQDAATETVWSMISSTDFYWKGNRARP